MARKARLMLRAEHAACQIQASWRAVLVRTHFLRLRAASIVVQREWRRASCQHKYDALRKTTIRVSPINYWGLSRLRCVSRSTVVGFQPELTLANCSGKANCERVFSVGPPPPHKQLEYIIAANLVLPVLHQLRSFLPSRQAKYRDNENACVETDASTLEVEGAEVPI